jgi:flagellar biosynthesis/type III secretory pathway protein FliH
MSKDDAKITPFEPRNLEGKPQGLAVKPFQAKTFGTHAGAASPGRQQFNNLVGGGERTNGTRFDLHPAAKKMLGVEDEESTEVEEKVNARVEVALAIVRDEAYQEAFGRGLVEGKAQAELEFLASIRPLYEQFEVMCKTFEGIKQEMYAANEQMLMQLMFQIGKNVVLKELSTDREYVQRVLGMMVEKIGAKDHVKLKISRQDFANIEQIRQFLKVEFPELKNVQIEASDDLVLGGCKIETDLARINASVETQFRSIEKSLGEA